MCGGCWDKYGRPTTLPSGWQKTVQLIEMLYDEPDCGVGGPLHVVLDDWNLEDEHLEPYEGDYAPRAMELAQRISRRLRAMTLSERAAVLAAADGMFLPES